MPKFVLKYQLEGKPNRNRPDQTVERDRLVLGSRPSADVFVKERLVGAEAAVLTFDGVRLTVEITDDFGGAFLEGRPVAGRVPFPDGASLQMGYLLVKPAIDAAKATCTLTVSEGHLPATVAWFVRQEKPEREFALEASGPQEHLWGRSPVLRRLNGVAAVLGAAALLGFPLLKDTAAVTRGDLAAPHRAGSSKDAPADCKACHEPFSSDYGPKCAHCHAGFEKTSLHPYDRVRDVACSTCHEEHRGAGSSLLPPPVDARAGAWPALCLRCHGPLESRSPRGVRDRAAPPSDRVLLVDGFSHEDHRIAEARGGTSTVAGPPKGKVPVACVDCHRKPEAGGTGFGAVPYERCLDCHANWSVAVHGRDEKGAACLRCHQAAPGPEWVAKDLRTVSLASSGSRYALQPRRHDYRADECLRCHVLGREGKDGKTSIASKVFRHDHHLESVDAAPGSGPWLSRRCVECHGSVAGSDTLAGTAIVDMAGCARCHTDGAPTPVAVAGAPARTVTDMFHRTHLPRPGRDSLAAGCLSCHLPVAGEGRMGFRGETRNCAACHTRHENLEERKCAHCHLDRTNPGNRDAEGKVDYRFLERGIFEASAATRKPRGAVERFDHFSRGHEGRSCAECHDEKAVDRSRRVLDVPLPETTAGSCAECHGRTRFHR